MVKYCACILSMSVSMAEHNSVCCLSMDSMVSSSAFFNFVALLTTSFTFSFINLVSECVIISPRAFFTLLINSFSFGRSPQPF